MFVYSDILFPLNATALTNSSSSISDSTAALSVAKSRKTWDKNVLARSSDDEVCGHLFDANQNTTACGVDCNAMAVVVPPPFLVVT